jgi:hypothetical protein
MKILKSVILGAALVAGSWGAQAADLPVKAKPVNYVKICSAYGAGFYYIPGTDICLRVGGFIYSEWSFADRGNQAQINADQLDTGLVHDRNVSDLVGRARMTAIMDARTSTPYGTLRSYVSLGFTYTTQAVGPNTSAFTNITTYPERAFIQIGGWTFGYVASFFDFSSGYSITTPTSISYKWVALWAYTLQAGNGVSATLSVEDSAARRNNITTTGAVGAAAGPVGAPCPGYVTGAGVTNTVFAAGLATNCYGGQQIPDVVGNLRVDQAWGSAQISGLLHQVRANVAAITAFPAATDVWGGAILGGLELKTPTGPGDSFLIQGVWSNGAIEATGISSSPIITQGSIGYRTGGLVTTGQPNDAVGPVVDLFDSYVDAAGHHLTRAWSVNGQFRHFWDPMTRSAIFAGYTRIDVAAAGNAAGAAGAGIGYPDGTVWQVGANTIWSPVKDLDIGLEVLWTRITASCQVAAGCAVGAAAATVPAANVQGRSEDVVSAIARVRRNW